MNDNPFFSIGIASYNYADRILKGLNQIKIQKFHDYEVIISDDCSTDNSVRILEEYIYENPEMNIRLIVKDKNEGLIANKNTIIENHKGKYLLLCDADDWMSDDLLIKAYEVIIKENPDRLICDIAHINEKGKIIQTEHASKNQIKWGWLIHHASFYKSDIIRSHNIKIDHQPDDVFFILKFSTYCNKMSILNDAVYYYWLVHIDSSGRKTNNDFMNETFKNIIIREKKLLFNLINVKKNKINNSSIRDTVSKEKQDLDDIKLVLLKLYCFDILFRMQKLSLKLKIYYYKMLKQYCLKNVPDMWECEHLRHRKDCSLRKVTMIAIKLIYLLENNGLMIPFLCIFHLITKVIYIDQ